MGWIYGHAAPPLKFLSDGSETYMVLNGLLSLLPRLFEHSTKRITTNSLQVFSIFQDVKDEKNPRKKERVYPSLTSHGSFPRLRNAKTQIPGSRSLLNMLHWQIKKNPSHTCRIERTRFSGEINRLCPPRSPALYTPPSFPPAFCSSPHAKTI